MSILACLKSLDHFQIDKSTSRQHSKCLVMLAKRVFPGKKSKIPNVSEFALKSQVDDGDLDLLSMSIIALSSSIGLGWNRTDVSGKEPGYLLSCNLRENSFSRIHEFSVTRTMCLVRVESCVRRLRKQSDGIKSFDLNMASSRAVEQYVQKQQLFRGRHLMELVGNVVLVCSYRASVQTRRRDFE